MSLGPTAPPQKKLGDKGRSKDYCAYNPTYFTLRLVTTTLAGLYNYWREKLAVATYQGWDDKPCYGVLSLHWMTYASNIVSPNLDVRYELVEHTTVGNKALLVRLIRLW
jgi:hypothetical protein